MTTMEDLFMQIFDRRRWIVDQLRQQLESYNQSVALNLLAEGGDPPPWILGSVPDGADCLGRKDPYRQQVISGSLNPLPRACTPSVNRTLLFGQPVSKDYAFQPSFLAGSCVSTKYFCAEDRNNKEPSGAPVSNLQHAMFIDTEVVQNKADFDHHVHEKGDSTGNNSKSDKYTGRMTRSTASSIKLDSIEKSSNLKNPTGSPGHGCRFDQSRSVSEKQLSFVDSLSKSAQLLYQAENGVKNMLGSQGNLFNKEFVTNSGLVIDAYETDNQQACAAEPASGNIASDHCLIITTVGSSTKNTQSEPRNFVFDDAGCLTLKEDAACFVEQRKHQTSPKVALAVSSPTLSSDVVLLLRDHKNNGCISMNEGLQPIIQKAEAVDINKEPEEDSNEGIGNVGIQIQGAEPKCNFHNELFDDNIPQGTFLPNDKLMSVVCQNSQMCMEAGRLSNALKCHNTKLLYNVGKLSPEINKKCKISSVNDSNAPIAMLVNADCSGDCPSLFSDDYGTRIETKVIQASAMEAMNMNVSQLDSTPKANTVSEARHFLRSSSTLDNKTPVSVSHEYEMGAEEYGTSLDTPELGGYDGAKKGTGDHLVENMHTPKSEGYHELHEQERNFTSIINEGGGIVDSVKLSPKNYDVIEATNRNGTSMTGVLHKTTQNTAEFPKNSKSRYFLRSSLSIDTSVAFDKSNAHHDSDCLNILHKVFPHACEVTWPKRRKRDNQAYNIFGTTSRIRIKPTQEFRKGTLNAGNLSESAVEFHCLSASNEVDSELLIAATKSPSEDIPQRRKPQVSEVTLDTTEEVHIYQELTKSTGTILEFNNSVDVRNLLHFRNTAEHELSECSGFVKGNIDTRNSYCSADFSSDPVQASFLGKMDLDACSESVPEFEGFSMGVSYVDDDVVAKNPYYLDSAPDYIGAHENLSTFNKTPLLNSSRKHTIHRIPDAYHSLPVGSSEQTSLNNSLHFSSDCDHFKTQEAGNPAGFYVSLISEPERSFLGRPKSFCASSVSFPFACDGGGPFTPPIIKHYQRIISEGTGASSGRVSLNPEFDCFRIDEESSIYEKDLLPDGSELVVQERNSPSGNMVSSRKALADVTSLYQNAPSMASTSGKCPDRGSLDSVSTEAYFGFQLNDSLSISNAYESSLKSNVKNKENRALSVSRKKTEQSIKSLRNRSSKPKVPAKVKEQNKYHSMAEKGCKPANIVSNVSSLIPLVQRKQHAAALATGKRDIKVRALEAAEAAKRTEEKREEERKLKKEAVRLERLRIEQENTRKLQLERKQKEEKRKKEAQIKGRKRQIEEGKKEQQRKKRCIEETLRQRQQEDKLNVEKKDMLHKTADVKKEWTKEVVKHQIPEKESVAESKELMEVDQNRPVGDNLEIHNAFKDKDITKVIQVTNTFDKQREVQEKSLAMKESRESQSYEISPYRDSDNEDEEENKQKRKAVPLWARRESLARLLDLQKHMDPAKIFCGKNSCSLNEVLSVRIRQLPFAQL